MRSIGVVVGSCFVVVATTRVVPARAEPDAARSEDVDERALARLDRTLAYHESEQVSQWRAFSWAFVGLGATALGSGVVLLTQPGLGTGGTLLAIEGGIGIVGGGVPLLLGPSGVSPYSELRDEIRSKRAEPAAVVVGDIELAWAHRAQIERGPRRTWAGIGIGAGALSLASAAYFYTLAYSAPGAASGGFYGLGAFMTGLGVLDVFVGAMRLATDGPVETAWRAYRYTTGHGSDLSLSVSLTGLRGTF
jgi:hypothetical protein